jgi:hypothetical protein
MNNIETMRLALEALKCLLAGNSTAHQAANAITALRQAIEQAQQAEPDYYGLTKDHLWMSITKDHYDRLKPEFRMACYTSPPPLQPEPVIDKSAAIRIATALGWTPPRQPEQCQCPKCKVVLHASDCAVHSEPAYPKGECNCGATKPEPVAWIEHHKAGDNLVWDEPSKGTPLYTSPQKQPPVIDKSVARRIASQLGWEPPRQPLTDEQWQEIANLTGCLRIEKRGRDAIMRIFDEAAYGIKGEA